MLEGFGPKKASTPRCLIMVSTSVIGSLCIHGLAEYIGYHILRRGHDYGVLSAYPSHDALLLPRDSPAFIVALVSDAETPRAFA